MNKKKPSRFISAFVKITGAPGAYIFYKPKVYYVNRAEQNLKLPKPCILMSNHTSLLDFPLYLAVFPFRMIRFLMAEVLFTKGKLLSSLLYWLGGIFVDRDAYGYSFIEESVATLDKGGTVGVFPEGRLPVNGKSFPFKPGIAVLAAHSEAPIVPVCTDGNYGLFKRAHILVGEKIYFKDCIKSVEPSKDDYEEFTLMLENKMNSMKEELRERIEKE